MAIKQKVINSEKPTNKERRWLKRHNYQTTGTTYADNMGQEYSSKIQAQVSSGLRLFLGCLQNGFPICVKHLHYKAWAFYPFFFMRSDLEGDPTLIINHERIHCRQQMEIHLCISLPLAILFGFLNPLLLVLCPFVPTIIYYLDWLRCYIKYHNQPSLFIRKKVCFELEADSRSTNLCYLADRKWFAFLGYTGIKILNKLAQ